MTCKLDELFTGDERLDMWAEMMALATAMMEYCDSWWLLDDGMRAANDRRCGVAQPPDAPEISD